MKRIGCLLLAFLLLFSLVGTAMAEDTWTCAQCGHEGNTRNFCPFCGGARPVEVEPLTVCPACGAELEQGVPQAYCWVCGAMLVDCKAGDIVRFGHYEQDNNGNDGTEEIEWLVLDVNNGKALVISKYVIENQPYHLPPVPQNAAGDDHRVESVSWEECPLRKWLNETFISQAFTQEEQAAISPWTWDNMSEDRVFLLSLSERRTLLPQKSSAIAMPTKSVAHILNCASNQGCWWILRNSEASEKINFVDWDGITHDSAWKPVDGYSPIRPALWINLASGLIGR